MIVAVKNNNNKKFFVKLISLIVVVVMFVIYYNYMSDEFSNSDSKTEELQAVQINKEEEKKNKLEKLIYREIETAVDLIGQRNVQAVKLISNRVLIVADTDTNLDALKVRYGTLALIKKDIQNTKIAIDLEHVIKSKLNEE